MIEMKIRVQREDDDERYVNDEKKNCGDDDHDCVDYGYDDDNYYILMIMMVKMTMT